MNESDYRWVDDASVDISGDAALVVWVDQTRKDVFFQSFTRAGASGVAEPVNVSRSAATFSWLPRLAAGPKCGAIHVLWQEIVFSGGSHGGEIASARSVDGGRTFSEPLNLSNSEAGDGKGRLDRETWDNGSLDVTCAPGGALYAVWTEYEGALWLRRSSDNGSSFAPALQLAGEPSAPARAPSVAVGGGDRVHVAWAVGETKQAPIRVRSSADGGVTFGATQAIGTPGAHADAPQIAVDASGAIHLVFAESARGRGGPYQVRYARAEPGAAAFSAPRRLKLRTGAAGEAFPTVSVDARERVFVLWEVSARPDERPRSLAMSFSRDRGAHFGEPFLVRDIAGARLGYNGSQQGMLADKLATSGAGAIAVVNSTFDPGRASHVWLLRGRLRE